jgi:hypothetical protein
MPLPTNPLASLIANVNQTISQASNTAGGLSATAASLGTQKVNDTVNRLSGAIGSGLNGFASGAGIGNNIAGSLNSVANSALSGIANSVQSSIAGGVTSLQQAAGSISNATADIAGSINKLGIGGDLASGISSLAGTISSVAGQVNNLLSIKRGANLPSGAELFKQTNQRIELRPSTGNDWRVRLNAEWTLFNSPMFTLLKETGGVVWPYLPQITVSTKANYTQIDPTHNNFPFQAYKNSQVDEISISGEFSAETETDAAYWIAATTFFKTATKMFFGQGANAGNPPIICNLSGYGGSVFNNVPVIVKSFSVDLNDDVNYINCNIFNTNTWVPVMSTISVTVQPIYNRERLRKFSLRDYASGQLGTGPGFI